MLCGRLPFDDEYIPALFKKINGGIFTLPSFLSSATKALLSAMLVVDPMKRITIAEIRKTDWFNINLPDYLQPLPDVDQDPFQELDASIVSEIQKRMGFSKETVYHALREPENNQIKVAYQLILDHKRIIGGAQRSSYKGLQSYLLASPPAWNAKAPTTKDIPALSSSINTLTSTLPKRDESLISTNVTPPKKKVRSKWHFGIRSRSPPFDIMLEIYRALKNLGMQWKTIDPYHIRCRYVCARGVMVKMDIQLFRIEANSYLVDFKNSTPPTTRPSTFPADKQTIKQPQDSQETVNLSAFAFFDACSKLITELAISG
ncbi:Protein kinase [Quaeritorhiza haematococci]|nr:Protein kinase [Quaeritorhiza haematococci]